MHDCPITALVPAWQYREPNASLSRLSAANHKTAALHISYDTTTKDWTLLALSKGLDTTLSKGLDTTDFIFNPRQHLAKQIAGRHFA